ncbi:MAG: T9SS type B sorting domain-containing protein [Saprospiraceae bacterium]
MRQILILWHILFLVFVGTPLWLHAQNSQNCGFADTTIIRANRTTEIDINITDVINNDLADPNQGICGIELGFVHQLSENLEIWLTSPAGQRIQLIGPNTPDNTAFTFRAQWNINFVPCAATAVPDSGYVAKWNNGQPNNFINGGRYRGSYYPFVGCLEDFNMGPVNGTWKITITNNPSTYQGAITFFRLKLCDERGFLCCNANPGSLASYPDVTACEGSAALRLNLQPDFGAAARPDSVEYGHTFMISKDGILLEYDSLADLRDLPVGNYQVCGLSYRRSDLDSFPQPDGVLRLDAFRQQLNGDSLLYCGLINTNCVDVRITGGDTIRVQRDICQGESVQVGNQTFNASGDYFVTLAGSGGCDSIINLKLSVVPGLVTNLTQEICAGDSIVIGSSVYKATGMYSDTLTSVNGCDSIVNLNLRVLRVPPTFLTEVICQGETFSAGGQTFDQTGQYDIIIPAANGCDSLINLTLLVLGPTVNIAAPDTLGCNNPTVTLDGSASEPEDEIDFTWTNLAGDTLGMDSTLTVDVPGIYILTVSQTVADFTCATRDTVEVFSSADTPIADLDTSYTINCATPTITIGGANTSIGPNIRYRWHIINGNIVGDTTQRTATVDASGEYMLIVTNIISGCSDTASTRVLADFTLPIADVRALDTLNCDQTTVTLDIGRSSRGANIRYTWRNANGTILGEETRQTVDASGKYYLDVVNIQNGCTARDSIEVEANGVPAVTFGDTVIPCDVDTFIIQAAITPANGNFAFFWTGDGVVGSGDVLSTPINRPGEYILTIINLDNDCVFNEFITITQQTDCDTLCVEGNLPDTLTCLQDTIALSATLCAPCNNCIIEWTTSNGNIISSPDSLVILVNQPGNYTLTVKNPNGDSTSIVLEVLQNISSPTANAGADITLTCAQTSASLNGNTSATNARYTWTTADGNITSGANTLTPVVDAPGNYVLTVLDTLTNCASVDTVMVVASEDRPDVPTFGNELLTCLNPTVTLDGSAFVGGNLTGRWCQLDSNNLEINCLDNPLLIVSASGTYRFQVTNTTTGCNNSVTVRILDNKALPSIEAGATDTLNCVQPTLTLNPTITPANGDYRYRWTSVNGNLVSNDSILNPIVILPDIYILEVTNQTNGCVATDSIEILQNAEVPSVFAGFDTLLNCKINTIQLEASALGNNLIYEWTTSTGNIVSGANSLNPVVNQPGTYFFRAINPLSNCVAEDTLVVGQNIFEPTAAVRNSEELNLDCQSNALTLDGCVSVSQTSAALRYRWQALNGAMLSNPDSCSITVSRKGDYQLLVEDQSNGCRDSITVTVNQNPNLPAVTLNTPDSITCLRDSVTLTAQLAGSTNNLSISWIAPNGQALPDTDLDIITTLPGSYTFIIINRINGCSDSTTVNVGIDTLQPLISIAPPNSLDCQVQTATLVATVTNGRNFAYNWTTTDGSIVSGAMTSTAVVDAGGNYTLRVTNLSNGCSNQAVTGVKEGESSIAQAFFTVTPANCLRQGSGFVQIDSVRGGTAPYLYSLGDLPFASFDYFQNIRAGTYTLRVQDVNGCEWQTQVVVDPPEPITVDIGKDTLIQFGDTIQLVGITDESRIDSVAWFSNGDTLPFANTLRVTIAPPLSSEYWIYITATNGCTAKDYIKVAVAVPVSVYTPNVFSPDGDGINDVFMIYAGENVRQVRKFMIFDRWGNRLLQDGPFAPNDPEHGWDGTFNGQPMDIGVYVFYAEVEIVDGRIEIVKGDITLLR